MTNRNPVPKLVIIDADILLFRAAWWADVEGANLLENRIKDDVKTWTPEGCSDVILALSCSRADGFRKKLWQPYKEHRDDTEKPGLLPLAVKIAKDTFKCVVKPELEADDLMGIAMSSHKAVCSTIDKDLASVPGWLYKPPLTVDNVTGDLRYIDQEAADYQFYTQWLMGDKTDNIPGIWKCGPKKAAKILENNVSPDAVIEAYSLAVDRDGNPYTAEYVRHMAWCTRILRKGEYTKKGTVLLYKPPQFKNLEELMEHYRDEHQSEG